MAWGDDAPIIKRGPKVAPAATMDAAPVVKPGAGSTKGSLGDRLSLGFDEGFARPVENAAHWAEAGLRKLGVPIDAIERVTDPKIDDTTLGGRSAQFARREETVTPHPAGRVAGNIAGTVPMVLATKNPYLAGAGQGALLTEHPDDPGAVAFDAGAGAVLNKLGGVAVDKLAAVAKPVLAPAVQIMRDAGVKLSPGQIKGAKALVGEDKRASQPIVGDAIAADRAAFKETVNRGALNRALMPLGIRVPDHIPTGHEAVAFAQDAAGSAYDHIMPKLSLQADPRIAVGIRNGWEAAQDLPADLQARFLETVKGKLRFDEQGVMQGRPLATGVRALKKLAADFSKSGDPDQRILGEALGHVDDGVQSALRAQNPGFGRALDAANKAYKGVMIVSGAAKGADDGVFSTGALKAAVRQADRTKNQRATAAGRAYMQDFSNAARDVTSSYPDSGTAGRLGQGKLIPTIQGGLNAVGYQADKAYTDFLAAPRPAWAGKLADFLRKHRAVGGALVPGVFSGLTSGE